MKRPIRYLLMSIALLLIGIVFGLSIYWHMTALERDIDQSHWVARGLAPDYNLDVPFPISDTFDPWEKASFPASGVVASSTEYFRNMVSNKWFQPYFGLFALSGIPTYDGEDPAMFKPENNAWCVTADLIPRYHTLPRGPCPFMFTRNLDITRLSEAKADRLRDVPPYGLRGVLVVMTDCSAKFLRPEQIESDFNPLGFTNAVLRP